MTIASTTNKVSYNGAGSAGPFSITFKFLKDADIVATHVSTAGLETTLTITTDYTLTGAGDPSGGTLTLTSALAVGEKLVIKRSPSIVQETDYVENSAFPAESHETALDLLTMICQGLQEQVDRSVKVDISSSTDPDDLLDELAADVVSAAASAATATTQAGIATTQAGLAATARIAAELAETNAETAETNAETAQGVVEGYASGATPWPAPDINGGTADSVVIGGTTPAAGTFTALTASNATFTTMAASNAALSGGITLGGGTDSLNVYEFGEWTPELRGATGGYAHTYAQQVGRYIRKGREVTVWGHIILSALDATMNGHASIHGLPYATADITGINANGQVVYSNITLDSGFTQLMVNTAKNVTHTAFQQIGSGQTRTILQLANFAADSAIIINMTYLTA